MMIRRKWTLAALALTVTAAIGAAGVANAGAVRVAMEQGREASEAGEGSEPGEDVRELAALKSARVSLARHPLPP